MPGKVLKVTFRWLSARLRLCFKNVQAGDMVLGLFKSLFKRYTTTSSPAAPAYGIIRLTKGGFFEVVGEAQYQRELEEICGGRDVYSTEHQCQAILVPEPNNPVDPNAVQIVIERRVVAYLTRQHAIEYRKHIGMRASCCDAKIVGGWDDGDTIGHFGVKLKIKWPPKERKIAAKPASGSRVPAPPSPSPPPA